MTAAAALTRPALARLDGALVWAVPDGWSAISSAAVGGGLVRPRWVLNARVGEDFVRTDLEAWALEQAARIGLDGPGCALLTAADVGQVEHAEHDGVSAWATVGVTKPTWPHDPRSACPDARAALSAPVPGTVNIVVALPVALTASALVQAVGTVTEAKAQVLVQAGVPGTGTASDAVVVLCPPARTPELQVPFAGVRSGWGRRVARTVHDAVLAGLTAHPWTGDDLAPVW